MKAHRKIIVIFGIMAVLSVLLYMFMWMLLNLELLSRQSPERIYTIVLQNSKRKGTEVLAILVSACLIAVSSLLFQTLTKNRILTPGLIGFDSMFVMIQTVIVFFYTTSNILFIDSRVNFVISSLLMVLYTLIIYRLVLRKNRNNIVFLLLVGMILSTLSRNLSTFFQSIMDPGEFDTLVLRTQMSISNMNTSIIWMALPIMLVLIFLMVKEHLVLDVMALGEDEAINLGVDYHKKNYQYMIYIAISMSVATALIGPMSFLGLITVNMAREFLKTNKHLPTIVLSSLIAIVFLVLGQTIVASIGFRTTVSVLISIIGGGYMIYLVLKENRV